MTKYIRCNNILDGMTAAVPHCLDLQILVLLLGTEENLMYTFCCTLIKDTGSITKYSIGWHHTNINKQSRKTLLQTQSKMCSHTAETPESSSKYTTQTDVQSLGLPACVDGSNSPQGSMGKPSSWPQHIL
eukprot:363378-Chlamydomonas_euryale.AAC.44